MNGLVLMPTVAENRTSFFADAEVVEPIVEKVELPNHFIQANTVEVTLEHLANDCVTPVFAKDNELTINHVCFIHTVEDCVKDFFRGEQVNEAQVRASHVIKGRVPSAIHKPANQLLESDKTIYYERCAFSIDVPTIYQDINGNRLYLSVVGVRAYNQQNLYSKKVPELFRVAIGFKNSVCCNMCVFTDGYKGEIRVSSTRELYQRVMELLNQFNAAKQIHLMQQLCNSSLSEHQFSQILGKMRLYQYLPMRMQQHIPRLLITDTMINNVAKSYITDENFSSYGTDINMWKFYNLLTGANKSSYIDTFLDRSLNASEIAMGINGALNNTDERYRWFID
ncbi:MAG: DUF3871 family protein [Aeriscardovia sp.]|nr:DUF3871 family protein [Aeriscardovia sp.]